VHTRLSPAALLAILVVLGVAVVLANRRLPLVRNSLVYASASQHVIEHGYDPRPVVADSKLYYDKPVLYDWMSAPLVERFGAHDGLRITSFLGTVAYLLAVLYFARAFRSSLPEGSVTTLLWLSALGPCVLYQFWSAHPDGWFAALVVLVWGLAHRIVSEPESGGVRRVVLAGVVIYLAILLKNYGLVLLLSVPLYLLVHFRALRTARAKSRGILFASLGVFVVIGVLVVLAWTGHHPFSRLEGEGGGVGQYGKGELWKSARGTWTQVGLSILLQFQVALLFAAKGKAWGRATIAPLLCFGGVYIAGLMPFPTTFYNMRYFLPLFPLVALILVRGAAEFGRAGRQALFGAHALVGAALVVVFNFVPAYRAAEPTIPVLVVDWIGTPLSLLDNLRMKLHLDQQAVLENIERQVPAGSILYMMDVVYYGDAQHGVFERDGRIRSDIVIRYVSSRSFGPTEPTFYVYDYLPRRPALEPFGKVTDLGLSLYRVEADAAPR
jgi:hypothetical protein